VRANITVIPALDAISVQYLSKPHQLGMSPRLRSSVSVFAGLDELSSWLKADENFGYGVLFFLIFLTTFRK